MPDRLLDAIKAGTIAEVKAAVKADPAAARHPRAIGAAAGAAFLPAIELLVRQGADLNASYRNYRPIHNLLQSHPHATAKLDPGRLACLDWMLEHGADPEQLGAWPPARALIIAAFGGQPESVKHLHKAGAKVDGFTGAALGDRIAVEKALKEQPGFALARDRGGLTALQCAAGSALPKVDTLAIAQLLLDAGADPNARTKSWASEVTPAYFAANPQRAAVFTMLLDRGADSTEAVSHAVWGKHYGLAEIALEHGAELDRATANGKPLLNDLIRWGQIPQMMWTLEHGASPNVADAEGWTAVHRAASRGNERMMRAVLDAGGDMTRRCHKGFTPVQFAVLAKREKLLPMMAG